VANYKDYDDLYDFLNGTAPGASRGSSEIMDVFNDTFAFNPSTVRTGKVLANGSFDTNATTKLTRGFIRNLMVDLGDGQVQMPNIRCRFQFNPQDIEHSLEARRDMYLPILQDPQQLRQPMAGNAAFAFELIFDRTMEVNSKVSKSSVAGVDDESPGEETPDETSAETVGVFHDLRILYSIIGTGLSKELLDAQMKKARLDILSYAQRNYSELNIQRNSDGNFVAVGNTDETGVEGTVDQNSQELVNFLSQLNDPLSDASGNLSFMSNLNIGNSAFLTPQPCRVIFSPMFMVDGFVMNTRVLFTKFSAKMIPIQCKVFLQMQAVYIGFAKKQTFLTAQYEEQAEINTGAQQNANQAVVDICKILQTNMRAIGVGYSSDTRILGNSTEATNTTDHVYSVSYNKEGSNEAASGLVYQPIWLYGTKNFWYRRGFSTNPSLSKSNNLTSYNSDYYLNYNTPINTPNFMPGITVALVNGTKEKDEIAKKVFEDYKDSGPLLRINITSRIYGPFGSQVLGNAFVATKLGTEAKSYPSSSEYPTGVKLLGDYNVGIEIRDKATWEKYADRSHDFLLSSRSPSENLYNDSNQAANPITPSTDNSSFVSVLNNLDDKITTYTNSLSPHTSTQKANAKKVLQDIYKSSNRIGAENTDPKIDGQLDTLLPLFPGAYYSNIPDSLLELVNEVHGLNSLYFVVVTETSLKMTISAVANAGTQPFAIVSERSTDVIQGSTVGHKVSLIQRYENIPPAPSYWLVGDTQ